MRPYSTVVVIDMATSDILYRDRKLAPVMALLKPHKSGVEKTALQDQQTEMNDSLANENAATGTLSQFEGSPNPEAPNASPYSKALYATSTDATTNAYTNAQQAERADANAAGFGAGQPVGAAADTALQAKEAGALAQLPAQTTLQATQPMLQATGQQAQIGEAQGQSANAYMNNATTLEEQYQNMLNSFQGRLWNIGAGAVTGAVGA